MSLLAVQHVSTGYRKKQVLFDVNLNVEEGETVLLIGSNGSGKTTLFNAVFGILPLWSGEVKFEGEPLHNLKLRTPKFKLIRKGLMLMPQKNGLFEDMPVAKNLEMSLLHLNDKEESKKRIEEIFVQIDLLNNKRRQLAGKLSGGERKLLCLGMILVNQPKIVLFDEPLAGLSGYNISIVLKWLKVAKENGTTLVIIEHRIKELFTMADKVVGLKFGKNNTKSLENLEQIKSFML